MEIFLENRYKCGGGGCPAVIETEDMMYFYGAGHDKFTFAPKFRSALLPFLPETPMLVLHKLWMKYKNYYVDYLSHRYMPEHDKSPMYIKLDDGHVIAYPCRDIVRKYSSDGEGRLVGCYGGGDSNTRWIPVYYIPQSNQIVYCAENSYRARFYYAGKLNSNLGKILDAQCCDWSTGGFLTLVGNTIFFYISNHYRTNRVLIVKFDVSTNTHTVISDKTAAYKCNTIASNPVVNNGVKTFYIPYPATDRFNFYKVDIDDGASCTVTQIATDLNGHTMTHFNYRDAQSNLFPWILPGDKLALGTFESTQTSKNNLNVFAIYVFSRSDDSIVLLNRTQLPDRARGYLKLNDTGDLILVIYDSKVEMRKFNSTDNTFDLVKTFSMSCLAVGQDSLGRLWFADANRDVYFTPLFDVDRIDVRFVEKEVTWQGEPITTQVAVSAYDLFNNRVAVDVKLTIESGNAVFPTKDGDTLVQTVTTSTNNDVLVDVKVLGPGMIYVKGVRV